MAVAFEGFSIREYASMMRDVDVAKSWPFGGESADEIRTVLPPITVKKFRWWSDELELLGRSEERSKICEQNVDQEEIEVNPELSEMVLGDKLIQSREIKMKKSSRTPKKRSIVEIFAVAPQVERVDDDDDDEEEVCSEEKETHNSKVLALADVVCYLESKGKTKKMMAKKKKPNLKDEAMRKLKKQKRMSKAKKNGLKKTEAMAYGLYLLCEIKGIEECGAPASSAVRIGQ
ncbi:hypothetical protein Acr_00g0095960 [Actinidia rufa]|uniref:Uncharacterized protein n=1 Tax=Actinidia rufa TaxID=165716 RepID=A0A7J0DYL8_9ERIC|nr:hypothetical protein Acr_00g0095960 [Actinidia rufa]